MSKHGRPSYRRQIHNWRLLELHGYEVDVETLTNGEFRVIICKPSREGEPDQVWRGDSVAGVYEAFDLASQVAMATLPRLCQTCGRSE